MLNCSVSHQLMPSGMIVGGPTLKDNSDESTGHIGDPPKTKRTPHGQTLSSHVWAETPFHWVTVTKSAGPNALTRKKEKREKSGNWIFLP